jgi:transcriptional regulator with XRE-family HTH domain
MPEIGSKLRELRARRSLGMRELATRSGVSHSAISLIERDRMSPSVDTLSALLAALGTTMSAFFGDLDSGVPYSPFYGAEELVEIGRADVAEEAGIVVRGAVEVTVDGSTRVLREGDAYYFDSRSPHRFRNVSDGVSEIISAVTPPSY